MQGPPILFCCGIVTLETAEYDIWLYIYSRGEGAYNFVEMSDGDSTREACRVTALDIQAAPNKWRDATILALKTVRVMGRYGLTESEFSSILQAYIADLHRLERDQLASSDLVKNVMDCLSCGHTLLHLDQEKQIALSLLESTTLDQVNEEAYELANWLTDYKRSDVPSPSAVICCVPTSYRVSKDSKPHTATGQDGNDKGEGGEDEVPVEVEGEVGGESERKGITVKFDISEKELVDCIEEGMSSPLSPPRPSAPPPLSLMSQSQVASLSANLPKPAFLPPNFSPTLPSSDSYQPHPQVRPGLFSTPSLASSTLPGSEDLGDQGDGRKDTNAAEGDGEGGRQKQEEEGIVFRELNNGVKINYKYISTDKDTAFLRVLVPGGRFANPVASIKQHTVSAEGNRREEAEGNRLPLGSLVLGARSVMEGGEIGGYSREQVEMFCSEHLIGVMVDCSDEFITLDFVVPTGIVKKGGVSSVESAFQILHSLVRENVFKADAVDRAKSHLTTEYDHYIRDLQAYSVGEIICRMAGNDPRFQCLKPEQVEQLTLEDVKTALSSQLRPDNIEVNITGDIPLSVVEQLSLTYLGSLSPSPYSTNVPESVRNEALQALSKLQEPGISHKDRLVLSHVLDSDERALVHVCGYAPNRWGYLPDGSHVVDRMNTLEKLMHSPRLSSRAKRFGIFQAMIGGSPGNGDEVGEDKLEEQQRHRRHPAFARVCLTMLQDVLNRRMFGVLREEKQLTYDASFDLIGFERLHGGVFLLAVHANPHSAVHVLQEAQKTLQDIRTTRPITQSQVENACRQLVSRHDSEIGNPRYWLDLMSGMQLREIPLKTKEFVTDLQSVAESVTAKDLQLLLDTFGVDDVWRGIAISGSSAAAATLQKIVGQHQPPLSPAADTHKPSYPTSSLVSQKSDEEAGSDNASESDYTTDTNDGESGGRIDEEEPLGKRSHNSLGRRGTTKLID
eukprot:GHVQ01025373.1.p1 GENE.GHVQ01025373.1~~GHVQ01025373.1.p1  ORF type:complete len:960 (+),score=158.95 GHVQ01025373.1:1846-4725(+)